MAFLTTFPLFLLPKSFFTGENSGKSVELTHYTSISEMMLNSLLNAAVLSAKIICLITIIIFLMDALQRTKFIMNYGQRVQTAFSLLAGQLLGITYGAGILFKEADSGNLEKRDIFFIGTFLMICHSLLEDPLLFVIFGANYWVLIGSRLAMACLVTFLISQFFRNRDKNSKKAVLKAATTAPKKD
jgi:hypothetical protein